MKYQISKFHVSILLIALLGILLLASVSISDALRTSDAPASEQNQSSLPIVFDGITYTREEFEQTIGEQYIQVIFLNSDNIEGDESGVLYAFTNTDDLELFATANGVKMTGESSQPDILPLEIQADE